ncbi:MAG: hypothetical protein HC831_11165 [Chloroflexia bacterium]|nr:hypothetical protein [Chloroflexia bacterium]
MRKFVPNYKTKATSGMGYFFIFRGKSIYYAHDMPEGVKSAGDSFFKEQALKK